MLTSTTLWFVLLATSSPATSQATYMEIPGAAFRSTIRHEGNDGNRVVADFALMQRAVSNREFQAFVQQHPHWRRDRVPALFADSGYLLHWRAAGAPEPLDADRPVTRVSWFAVDAYCKAQQARLPDWAEWEYVAAADTQRHDARHDPAWRKRLFADGTARAVDAAGDSPANAYGVHGLHGASWEWVGDFSTLLGDSDKRGADDGDRLQFCGATGLSFNNRDDYAALKRVALLSAMQPRSTLGNLGFRCARSRP
ncbi:formylglycine-generating enzyme family protein [Lysobacter sp. S4-A87]|uniref:formylglycine-generating enzyme family protein n=1 Tax=Lysobacter sp. S4-A87 TaxID=2925843 RepID=UPI001F53B8CE|nr:formylglycine-generating enzyme family protein [Lysobacter sp. S4-A87]UNK49418.1 formylglycine-generating enzyme family protein [Lysobacter sp. S4-A87]